jgi:hypothetical protein
VALLEAAVALGDTALLERLVAPVEVALAAAPVPAFGASVVLMAQEADMSEDVAEAQYHAAPSPATLRTWLRAIDAQRAAHRTLRTSIANQLESV